MDRLKYTDISFLAKRTRVEIDSKKRMLELALTIGDEKAINSLKTDIGYTEPVLLRIEEQLNNTKIRLSY